MEVYTTRSSGVGGAIKQNVDDFVVEEILVDGSKAETTETQDRRKDAVLGSSSDRNRYLLCVLVKRNWDTFAALRRIAQQLGKDEARVQIAGIKDAKAVTAQHITIEGASPEEARNVQLKDVEIRPNGYLRTELSPYYLMGNNFHIAIRNIKHSRTTVEKRITRIVEEFDRLGGVPNFFGHQRFGTVRPITHLVGKALVKGSLKKAAMLFLAKPSRYEHPSSRQARKELLETQDFKRAFDTFPNHLRYERLMLKSLVERPDDFAAAFRKLPVKILQLFVQAHQSYMFNRFLSSRIKKNVPLHTSEVGDYVMNLDRCQLPMPRMYKIVNHENRMEINNAIKNGKMRLAIPLVGFKQHLSRGIQGEIEQEILEEEGVSPREFRIVNMSEISSKGQLRAATAPLTNFSLNEVSSDASSRKQALEVDFMLLRGSYATIVLRELMKPPKPVEAGF